jgi:class 3 adenylate cyclase/tetratricopeptide (TPR) repeat protein
MPRCIFEDFFIRWRTHPSGGGPTMTFEEVLDQAIAMLQRRGRVTYRALKRQFDLDDDALEDLKAELIEAQQVVIDEGGTVLVWTVAPTRGVEPTNEPTPTPHSYTPAHLAEKILTSKRALEGERKQVTVLFADLKSSMELLADRDPEEARQLLDPVLERLMAAVHQYEGTVNQVMGDGIMALFGAPIAHEDHAVRACYAALAMQEAIRRYSEAVRREHGIEVQIRVGLNSGEVVVRAIGNDLHMDYSAIGQTVHLAARMEQLAPPGTIRLTVDTLQLAEGLIQVTPLGPVPVKGLAAPVEVCELVGAGPARTRLQALTARGLTPFVGRQAELSALHQALAQARAGRGQVVAVVGDAGVGKTRLFHEFTQAARTQGWRVLESRSASYGQATPYLPVMDLLKDYFHLDDHDDGRRMREKLTGRLLTLDPALGPTLPAFLALLEVPGEDPAWQALDPPQRRQRTLDALTRLLLRESQAQPLLLVFENLHWIDAETQACLDGLVERLPSTRLFLLVNYRPEYQHGWDRHPSYAQLRLDPLPPASAEVLLQGLLGDDAGLEPLKTRLIAHTQGNPFFLEESVRTLVETQVLVGERGAYRLAKALPSIQVPATVQAVLAARIDRLPPEEKALLQTAAVIGTEVPLALLQDVAEAPETALRLGLTHLQAAQFLYETRLFPEVTYTFTHALTQQVAYEMLLQEQRRARHTRIIAALEALAGDRPAEQVDRLAHHALRGEVWDKALAYARQAGEKALARSAPREAARSFEQALSALARLPERRDTLEQAVDLRLALRIALRPFEDTGRMERYLCEAEALVAALDDPSRLGRVLRSRASAAYFTGAYDQAIAASERVLALATAGGDVVQQTLTYYSLGLAYQAQGDYPRAVAYYGQTMAALDGDRRYERFGGLYSPAVLARADLAAVHAELGMFPEGRTVGDDGLRIAEVIGPPASLMQASWGRGVVSLVQGDLHGALPLLERAVGLCQEMDLRVYFAYFAEALGAAYTLAGRVAEAVPLLTRAVEQSRVLDVRVQEARSYIALGEAQLRAGRPEEAHTLAERALTLARERQERGHQAYALRLLGEIAARREPPESGQAERSYRQALAVTHELGMRPLQAHCHLGLGMLCAKTPRPEQARAELSAAVALYRTMEMTFWLPRAEAALVEVEGR